MVNLFSKNKMHRIINFTIILLAVLSFSCSNKNQNGIVIKFWAMGSEAEFTRKLIPEFESRNPGIRVEIQQIPWTAAQEKLITAFASDNTPDACQLGNTWIPQFSSLKALEELDNWISNSATIQKNNFFEGVWETNVIDDKTFGIPWYVDTRLLFYRTDVLSRAGYDHPPRNWDELLDVSRKIKSLSAGKEQYPIYIPVNEWATFIVFGLQAGADLLKDENTSGNFSSPEFKEAFTYLIQFHKERLTPFGMLQVSNVYQALQEEFLSMYISGPWNIPEFRKWMKGDLADKWMTAPLPGYKDEYPGVSLAGGSSLVMFKESKHKNETWKFLEYLSEVNTQLEFYKLISNLPSVKDAWKDSVLSTDKYMESFYTQLESAVATPKIPEWEQIVFGKVQQYAEYAARGVMSIDEALRLLDQDADRILEKRRWLLSRK
jgi:multiple sugar transport system substrate-binding protein